MRVLQENLSTFIESKFRVLLDPEKQLLFEQKIKELDKKFSKDEQRERNKNRTEIWRKLVDETKESVYSRMDSNLKTGVDAVRKNLKSFQKGLPEFDPIFYRRHAIDAILFKLAKKDENSVKLWGETVRNSTLHEQPYKPVLLDVLDLIEKRKFEKIKELVF